MSYDRAASVSRILLTNSKSSNFNGFFYLEGSPTVSDSPKAHGSLHLGQRQDPKEGLSGHLPPSGKTGAARIPQRTRRARTRLRIYLRHRAQVNSRYQRIALRTFRKAVRDALDKAGLSQRFIKSAHGSRHTAIQKVVDVTGDIRAGQRLARHKSIITAEIYVHNKKRVE